MFTNSNRNCKNIILLKHNHVTVTLYSEQDISSFKAHKLYFLFQVIVTFKKKKQAQNTLFFRKNLLTILIDAESGIYTHCFCCLAY